MVEDIGGWLRRLRPSTAADENWDTSPDADQVLAAVHRATSRRRLGARFGVWVWVPTGALAVVLTVLLAVTLTEPPSRHDAGPIGAGPIGGGPSPLPLAIRPAAKLLSTEASCANLLDTLRSHTAANIGRFYQGGGGTYYAPGAPVPAIAVNGGVAAPVASAPQSTQTSGTNVQETGVDEPDIAKTDGDKLITLIDGTLRVVDASTQRLVGSLDLTEYAGWQGAQLLVQGDQALVMLTGGMSEANGPIAVPLPAGPINVVPASGESTFLFVDLVGEPHVTGTMRASGSYLDARLIGSTVRLVVQSGPSVANATKSTLGKAPLSAWLPHYSVTTPSGTISRSVGCERVSHPADFTGMSMLSIYTLDMSHLGADPNPITVAADGDTVYAVANSLYITSNPQWYCCVDGPSNTNQTTEIHRFDISGTDAPTYLGSGEVTGRLLSSYSLSDYQGYLRVAVTNESNTSNSVIVLSADSLKVAGRVDGLGKGERIYAVRFEGPTAYVVTFQQTDPLYVVDLSKPTAPKVRGELKLPGVSTYLHDAGDGRLLAVGQEITNGEGSAIEMSLFDVSNPTDPNRVGHVYVPNTPGPLQFDPHTFLYWQPTGLVVTPVASWDESRQSGRVLVARVSGNTLTKLGLLANPISTSLSQDGDGIERSFIVDGALWTVSGSGVMISNESSLAREAWIPFS